MLFFLLGGLLTIPQDPCQVSRGPSSSFTLCSLLCSFCVCRLRRRHDHGSCRWEELEDWARFGGPCMEKWIQNWDIQEQEVDPVTKAMTTDPDKVIHSSWFNVRHCQWRWKDLFLVFKAPGLGGVLEGCVCQEVVIMGVSCRLHMLGCASGIGLQFSEQRPLK